MNHAEWISYWYLRLNGFFPLHHFVVHRIPPHIRSTEIDLLAIRPPHVFEEVGGQDDDWDDSLITQEDRQRFIAMICEVKRGKNYSADTVFRPREIRYALNRFGILGRDQAQEVAEVFIQQPRIDASDSFQVRKLFIGDVLKGGDTPCDFVLLRHAQDFFKSRAEKYIKEKQEARVLFQSQSWEEVLDWIARKEGARALG